MKNVVEQAVCCNQSGTTLCSHTLVIVISREMYKKHAILHLKKRDV